MHPSGGADGCMLSDVAGWTLARHRSMLRAMPARAWFVLLVLPLLLLPLDGCRRRGKKPAPVEVAKEYDRALRPGEKALREVDTGELPRLATTPASRAEFVQACQESLSWLATATAQGAYPKEGIQREDVAAGLTELVRLLQSPISDEDLNAQIRSRFRAFQSVGWDGRGTVLFTGYCTPIYDASAAQDATFRYPLHKRPADLVKQPGDEPALQKLPDGSTRPYPARAEIESSGMLRGSELVWLSDPFEAYVVGVQGSGRLRMRDGSLLEVGFDGTNNHKYYPIGKDMVEEGKIPKGGLNLAAMRAHFKAHPEDLPRYLNRNPRYVFFQVTRGGPFGSLGRKVTSNVTVATDKAIFPPAAACLVRTQLATGAGNNLYAGLRLDQDTGGAIRAAGRCDLYMGVGPEAERRAGHQFAEGELYYLVLKR